MSQDNNGTEEEIGGYGTPTVEQEMGGDTGAGGTGNRESAGIDTNDPGVQPGQPPIPRDPAGVGFQDGDAVVPSADAEIDEANADEPAAGRFSSEEGQDAAGLPDGSGNDLPKGKSPTDDGDESFDAG